MLPVEFKPFGPRYDFLALPLWSQISPPSPSPLAPGIIPSLLSSSPNPFLLFLCLPQHAHAARGQLYCPYPNSLTLAPSPRCSSKPSPRCPPSPHLDAPSPHHSAPQYYQYVSLGSTPTSTNALHSFGPSGAAESGPIEVQQGSGSGDAMCSLHFAPEP